MFPCQVSFFVPSLSSSRGLHRLLHLASLSPAANPAAAVPLACNPNRRLLRRASLLAPAARCVSVMPHRRRLSLAASSDVLSASPAPPASPLFPSPAPPAALPPPNVAAAPRPWPPAPPPPTAAFVPPSSAARAAVDNRVVEPCRRPPHVACPRPASAHRTACQSILIPRRPTPLTTPPTARPGRELRCVTWAFHGRELFKADVMGNFGEEKENRKGNK